MAAPAPRSSQASPAASSPAPGTAHGRAPALSLGCVRAGLALLGLLARLTVAAMVMVSS
jgi:hypothetical protein